MQKLSKWKLCHVWLRLLLLQGSWNFERLQGGGWFYALIPVLRLLYGEKELQRIARDHVGYFNTHPYLAPAVAGAVIRMELDRARGKEASLGIAEFKKMVAAPYAAVGDALFWGGLRPLAAGVAILLALKGLFFAPIVFLLLFNALPLWFRIAGFLSGYELGIKSVEFLQRRKLPDLAIRAKETSVVLLGGVAAFMVFQLLEEKQKPIWLGFLAVPAVLFFGYLARRGVSTLLLVLLSSGLILLCSLFSADVAVWLP
ncbi:PTS system mannose/fructose/sorbose family transporter subunit IID [Geopsychrobacter electrodiphilus]|uniref:PTS system mannose/fructose/sorbose family transporter subunit IID n=1 Tax=Geopsychrobacter electrodiphilus TaxID=225196 RepID=UPI0003740E86|nr:PTS system mannose/fructose/sorbose family transporter subunit IID [Geopsychrobacter electrodiphilus]